MLKNKSSEINPNLFFAAAAIAFAGRGRMTNIKANTRIVSIAAQCQPAEIGVATAFQVAIVFGFRFAFWGSAAFAYRI